MTPEALERRRARDRARDYSTRDAERKQAKQSIVTTAKADGCSNCGSHTRLHFHHVDPTTKFQRISNIVVGHWSKQVLLDEMAKCIVLCQPCHILAHKPKG